MSAPHPTQDDETQHPTGWEPDLALDDTLLRQFVFALAAANTDTVRAMGERLYEAEGMVAADLGVPNAIFNAAMLTRPPTEARWQDILDTVDAFCAGGTGHVFLFSLWPTPDLRHRGWELEGHPPLLVRPPGLAPPPVPSDLEIRAVSDWHTLADFKRVTVDGFPFDEHQPFDRDAWLDEPVLAMPGHQRSSATPAGRPWRAAGSLPVWNIVANGPSGRSLPTLVRGIPLGSADRVIKLRWVGPGSGAGTMEIERTAPRVEELWEALYRSNVVGILYGQEHTVLRANDRFLQMVGRDRADLERGLDWMAMTPPEHRAQDERGMEVLRRGEPFPIVEKEYLRPDGSRVAVLIGGAVVNSEPYEWVSVVVDVSDHKELEWRLLLAERRHHEAELRTASSTLAVLQQALLPAELPEPPGMSLAARYSAAKNSEVGGDWYDAFLAGGRLMCTVGDVAGHGIRVTQAMGELRAGARTAALLSPEPAHVLSVLDRLVQRLVSTELATALFVDYDPDSRRLTWASAGHFPPLLVPAAGQPRYLAGQIAPPLGISGHMAGNEGEGLAEGDSLLLFTDGLVERRDEDIDVGLNRLLAAVRPGLPPEGLCDVVLDACLSEGRPLDDACVLVLSVTCTLPGSTAVG